MNKEVPKWKEIPKSTGVGIDDLNDLSSRIRDLEKREAAIKTDLERMERSSDRSTNFMMAIIMGIAVVFLATLVMVALDYFKNNEERFEQTTTTIKNFENTILDKYYTKEQIDSRLNASDKSSEVIKCVRNKGFFSISCFNL